MPDELVKMIIRKNSRNNRHDRLLSADVIKTFFILTSIFQA